MKRRNFIKITSAAALGTTISWGCTATGKQEKNIRWAMGWLLWRDFGDSTIDPIEAINDLHQLGASGIEFTPRPNELKRWGITLEGLKRVLAEKGMQVSGHYFSAPFYDFDQKEEIIAQLEEKMDSLKRLGAKNIIIGPPGAPENADRNELIKKSAEMLNELGRIALDQGIEIGIHPHLNTLIESPQEIDLAMQSTDPEAVFMSPDTGHIHLAGGDVLPILKKYKERLNYFHFKDAQRPFERPNFNPNLREIGQGEIDFKSIMHLLEEINYQGWINIEQDFTDKTPAKSAAISFNYVKENLMPIYS